MRAFCSFKAGFRMSKDTCKAIYCISIIFHLPATVYLLMLLEFTDKIKIILAHVIVLQKGYGEEKNLKYFIKDSMKIQPAV